MGGGTSSYQEIEETDCILLWGSNARETHPIFFHHLLAGLKRGAKLYAIDPRRTASAQWAEVWAGLDPFVVDPKLRIAPGVLTAPSRGWKGAVLRECGDVTAQG